MATYGKRFIITDRAGNLKPGQLIQYHATQESAISASRRFAPCWIIEEYHNGKQWKYRKDIARRSESGHLYMEDSKNEGDPQS